MPETEKTVIYEQADGTQVKITVKRANGYAGMKRSMLTYEAVQKNEQNEETDPVIAILRTMTYPDLIAATVTAEGVPWPMRFEEFMELPDDLISVWEEATYAVNPHWNPPGAADEKKE